MRIVMIGRSGWVEERGERGQEGGERRVRVRYCGGLEGMKGVDEGCGRVGGEERENG